MPIFTGVGAAMVTPFGDDGSVNYHILEKYIEHLISGGVSALVPLGTTGEPATLSDEEYCGVAEFVIKKAGGRVPVIVGAGSNSTVAAVKKAEKAKALGADGILVVTPYYNKCTQRGIVEHYKAIAEVGAPVIVYNVPSRTGVNIAPSTLTELAAIKNIAGIKEANGDIEHIQKTAKVCAQTGLSLYCGEDSLILPHYALGACGVISVAANPAPTLLSKLTELCKAGDYAAARELQFKLSDYIDALFCEVNPIPVKKAMQLVGLNVGAPRLPLTELEPDHTLKLSSVMQSVGLL